MTGRRLAIRGDLLDFTADPAWGDTASAAVRFRADHWLLAEAGRIVGVQAETPGEGWERHDHSGRLVMPGFVDTHVHSPQIDVIASYGTELLDWLTTHTFPAETRHADEAHAEAAAALFVEALLAHGTTSAVVFPTVHKTSVDALFAAAAQRGMRLVAGKVLMDRNAPAGLTDDLAGAERDSTELIARWHGHGRLAYAMTVRFAPTSTPEQLAMAGRFCRDDPSLYMQTHLAENRAEVQWVKELFPEARSYLDVYARAGLLHAKSVFAHGIWLDDADRAALPKPARRSRTRRRRTCSSAAACSAGAPPKRPACTSRWPATWAAAPASRCCATWPTPTRSRRWPASASPPGRRCTPPRAVPRRRSASVPRSARSSPAPWPTSASGTGRTARWRAAGPRWPAHCMSVSSPG